MGAVAWNVWTCASARRVASSQSVNRALVDARRLTRTDDGRSRRANGRDDDRTRRVVGVFFFVVVVGVFFVL